MHMDHYAAVTEDLRGLIAERLSVRAPDFPRAVRKAGRLLPSSARVAAHELIAVEARLNHPRLAAKTDPASIDQAAATVRAALTRRGAGVRAGRARSMLLAEIGFRAMVVIAVGIAISQMLPLT